MESFNSNSHSHLVERNLGAILIKAAFIIDRDKVYSILGFAKIEEFERAVLFFADTIHSFRRLSAKEAKQIKPARIKIYNVWEGDTLQSITEQAGRGPEGEELIALLNNLDVTAVLQPGEKIKIVTN